MKQHRIIVVMGFLAFSILLLPQNKVLAGAVIIPGDVKIVDGKVEKSLTGKAGNAENGRKLFFNRKLGNCLACHTNKDLADKPFHGEVGPKLDGVASRYPEAQLRAILVNSKKVFGDQTIMPSFYRVINDQRTRKEFKDKTILSAAHIEDILAYLKTLKE